MDMSGTGPMEGTVQTVFPRTEKFILEYFLETFTHHFDKTFQSWRTSGETYMIPIKISTGPSEEKLSSSCGKEAAKMQSIIEGEMAEAKVHSFLAQSEQHAFILQNFSTSRWRRIFKTLAPFSMFYDEIEDVGNIEIDFLILHAFAGVIAIECKSVKEFQKRRYLDSKKQLDKVDILLDHVLEMLAFVGEQNISMPVAKVVSFPFVEMNQGVKNPYNLGQIDLELQPKLWWESLLNEYGSGNNKFVVDPVYQNAVIFLLGMYSLDGSPKASTQNNGLFKSLICLRIDSPVSSSFRDRIIRDRISRDRLICEHRLKTFWKRLQKLKIPEDCSRSYRCHLTPHPWNLCTIISNSC